MRFKVDENLPVEAADLLRMNGHDALTVFEQSMRGHPDADVAAVCKAEKRALITLDVDFAEIRAYAPEDYSGILVLRARLQDKATVLDLISRTLPLLATEPLEGHLWIVDEGSIRIRPGN
jgi:predicted nuclease of predicted toxin-antitoxin system